MAGHAKKCVERYCQSANKTAQQLYKVSTPCIDEHHFKEEEVKSVGELSQVCSQISSEVCFYLARIGRPDILWSVNKLGRSITKWTKACDERLSRLISYTHLTCEYKQYCYVGNMAKQCMLWDCFKTPILQEILRIQNPLLEERYAKVLSVHCWEKVPNWECLCFTEKKGKFLSVYVNGNETGWKVFMKDVNVGEPTSFLDHFIWVALKENVKQAKILWTILEICLNPKSLLELQNSYPILRNLAQTCPHGPMI